MAREQSGLRKLAERRIRFPVGNNRVISVPYDLSTYILCRWQALAPKVPSGVSSRDGFGIFPVQPLAIIGLEIRVSICLL